jgi:hypothetical protein
VSTPILTTDYDETLKLIAVADHFRSHKLLPHIKERLYSFPDRFSVDLMALASTRDDWEMGQRVMRKLDTYRIKAILAQPGGIEAFFDKLRPTWRHTLMELIFFTSFNNKRLLYDWQDIQGQLVPPAVPAEEVVEQLEQGAEEAAVGTVEAMGEKRRVE